MSATAKANQVHPGLAAPEAEPPVRKESKHQKSKSQLPKSSAEINALDGHQDGKLHTEQQFMTDREHLNTVPNNWPADNTHR